MTDDQLASSSVGVLCHELLNRVLETLGQPFGQTQMELANGVRVFGGDFCERATSKHELDVTATVGSRGAEAATCQIQFDEIRGIGSAAALAGDSAAFEPACLTGTQRLGKSGTQDSSEPCVGTPTLPFARCLWMDPVEQSWAARPCADFDLFRDEACTLENSEVLADRVVVESDVLGELSDARRSIGLGDIAKQVVSGRIAESTGFGLDLVGRRSRVDPFDSLV